MNIFIERTKETKKITYSGVARALLDELSIQPEDVLIVKNGELITEQDNVDDTDEIKLLSVISGG